MMLSGTGVIQISQFFELILAVAHKGLDDVSKSAQEMTSFPSTCDVLKWSRRRSPLRCQGCGWVKIRSHPAESTIHARSTSNLKQSLRSNSGYASPSRSRSPRYYAAEKGYVLHRRCWKRRTDKTHRKHAPFWHYREWQIRGSTTCIHLLAQ